MWASSEFWYKNGPSARVEALHVTVVGSLNPLIQFSVRAHHAPVRAKDYGTGCRCDFDVSVTILLQIVLEELASKFCQNRR